MGDVLGNLSITSSPHVVVQTTNTWCMYHEYSNNTGQKITDVYTINGCPTRIGLENIFIKEEKNK